MRSELCVVIPNLDCVLAGRAVEEILAQIARAESSGRSSIEVVVVGRDRPGVVPTSPHVQWIETPSPLSPAAARNLGVAQTEAPRLLFTDADCVPGPDWIQALDRQLDRTPVAGGSVDFGLGGNRWAVADNIASFHGLLSDRPETVDGSEPLGSLNLAVRREAWEAVGPFAEDLVTSEDHDWFFRAKKLGLSCSFVPQASVRHADVRDSRQSLVDHATWYGSHFNAFRKKHPGIFDRGFTWKSSSRLRLFSLPKSWLSAIQIFRRHPRLLPAIRCLPAVALFRRTWYRTVADAWIQW